MTASVQTRHQPHVLGGAPAFVLGLIVVIAMAAAIGLGLGRLTSSTPAATDTSYELVEQNRAQFGAGADSSYDAVEKVRIMVVPAGDSSGERQRLNEHRPS